MVSSTVALIFNLPMLLLLMIGDGTILALSIRELVRGDWYSAFMIPGALLLTVLVIIYTLLVLGFNKQLGFALLALRITKPVNLSR